MVQSGNSRVKVTIYGRVNRAIRFASTRATVVEITSVDNDGIGPRASASGPSARLNKQPDGGRRPASSRGSARTEPFGTGFERPAAPAGPTRGTVRVAAMSIGGSTTRTWARVSIGHGFTRRRRGGYTWPISSAGPRSSASTATGGDGQFGTDGRSKAASAHRHGAGPMSPRASGSPHPGTRRRSLMGVGMKVSYKPGQAATRPVMSTSSAARPACPRKYRHRATTRRLIIPNAGAATATSRASACRASVKHNASGTWTHRHLRRGLPQALTRPGYRLDARWGRRFQNSAGWQPDDDSADTFTDVIEAHSPAGRTPGQRTTPGWPTFPAMDRQADQRGRRDRPIGVGYDTGRRDGLQGVATSNTGSAIHQNVDSAAADVYAGVSYDSRQRSRWPREVAADYVNTAGVITAARCGESEFDETCCRVAAPTTVDGIV